MQKRVIILSVLLVIILIGIVASAYFIYFFTSRCSTKECFDDALKNCKRTTYLNENLDLIMEYRIIGKQNDKCAVNVQLLQVKKGSSELAIFEKQQMLCLTDLGVISEPEKDLKNCHGILKEEIQNMIIQRLQAQIIENLGKIGEETTKVI